ncbi:MAG: hypothetical protein DRJ09_04505 [Bacteroidetes bacterium]|nr:MAG: hypothetical protein DRJ09_04505 [Bacteroidota bacterium]
MEPTVKLKARMIVLLLMMGLGIQAQDTAQYSFFIAGHTYGKPGVNNPGLHPPFKQKFEYIKSRDEIKFGVLTGDIVSPNPTAQDWDEVDADIAELGLPVYFAVGNHDMENRPLYESRYGDTYYYFIFHNDLFVVLDPNIDAWNISGDQLQFMKNTVNDNYETVDNIFVLFHQFLWWEKDNIYSQLKPNSFAGRADTINFWSEIEPFFHQLPNKVFFLAGDMGAAWWSSDFTYDSYDNLSYVCSGMGEEIGDNFVILNIDSTKKVSYDLICLNTEDLNCFGDLTDYQISPSSIVSQTLNIKVFPNPAKDFLNIKFKTNGRDASINLYNIDGRLLKKDRCNTCNKTLDLSNLPGGLYFLTITTDLYQKTFKVIIQ